MNDEDFTTTSFEPEKGLTLNIEFDKSLKIGFDDESGHESAGEVAFTEWFTA